MLLDAPIWVSGSVCGIGQEEWGTLGQVLVIYLEDYRGLIDTVGD